MNPMVIVANRLPVESGADGQLRPSPGGLVAALSSAITPGTMWVGWPGPGGGEIEAGTGPMTLVPVELSDTETEGYYAGFSNSVLWPLLHGGLRPVRFDRSMWKAYRAVNERFALRVAKVAPLRATVWVHDYHLLLVPRLLRARRPDLRIGMFLHVPFPTPRTFATLPWRRELIEGMLGADLLGFQVDEDVENFSAAAERLTCADAGDRGLLHDGRTITIGAFPISVDVTSWESLGEDAHDDGALTRRLLGDRHLFLGVDRLDYSKGISHRLQAFGELLDGGLLDSSSTRFVQIAVPTRPGIAAFELERRRVEGLVRTINERHGREDGTAPVLYVNTSLDQRQLARWYRAADTLVVTSLADGMNLVAKEFVASRTDLDAAVLISEFAGAAHDLDGAIVVNPYDLEATKVAMLTAVRMPPAERRARMERMRQGVRAHDVHWWAQRFLDALRTAPRWELSTPLRQSLQRHPSSVVPAIR